MSETIEERRARKAREYQEYAERNREKEIQRKRDYRARKRAEKESIVKFEKPAGPDKLVTIKNFNDFTESFGMSAAELKLAVARERAHVNDVFRDIESKAAKYARDRIDERTYAERFAAKKAELKPALEAARKRRDDMIRDYHEAIKRERAERQARKAAP